MAAAGLNEEQTWVGDLVMGGELKFPEFRPGPLGRTPLPVIDHDRLAAAIDVHLIDHDHRLPYEERGL
jgi:hypothetical protein